MKMDKPHRSVRERLGDRLTRSLGLAPTQHSSDNSMFDSAFSVFAKQRLWLEKARSLTNIYAVKLQEANAAAKNLSDHMAILYSETEEVFQNSGSSLFGSENENDAGSASEPPPIHELAAFAGALRGEALGGGTLGAALAEGLRLGLLQALGGWERRLEEVDAMLRAHDAARRAFDRCNHEVEVLTTDKESGPSPRKAPISKYSSINWLASQFLSADEDESSARTVKETDEELTSALQGLSRAAGHYQRTTVAAVGALEAWGRGLRGAAGPALVRAAQAARLAHAHAHLALGEALRRGPSSGGGGAGAAAASAAAAAAAVPLGPLRRPCLWEGRATRRGRLLPHPVHGRILGNKLELYTSRRIMMDGSLPFMLCDLSKCSVKAEVGQSSAGWDRYGLHQGAILISGEAQQQINLGFSTLNDLKNCWQALMTAKNWDPHTAQDIATKKLSRLLQFVQAADEVAAAAEGALPAASSPEEEDDQFFDAAAEEDSRSSNATGTAAGAPGATMGGSGAAPGWFTPARAASASVYCLSGETLPEGGGRLSPSFFSSRLLHENMLADFGASPVHSEDERESFWIDNTDTSPKRPGSDLDSASVYRDLLRMAGKEHNELLTFDDLLRWDELQEALAAGALGVPEARRMWARAAAGGHGGRRSGSGGGGGGEAAAPGAGDSADDNGNELALKPAGPEEFAAFLVLFVEYQIELAIGQALDAVDHGDSLLMQEGGGLLPLPPATAAGPGHRVEKEGGGGRWGGGGGAGGTGGAGALTYHGWYSPMGACGGVRAVGLEDEASEEATLAKESNI